ncbi:MAG TPA: LptA/OstA family protein [Longimicrobiales bacterium]
MKARWLLALATLLPQTAVAQQNSCELVDSRQFNSVSGGVVIYVGEPVFSCQNGSRILADSAIILPQTGRADFIGHVRFTDRDRTLTADQAQYVSAERRVMAQSNVELTNRRDGSTLRATSLDYFQPSTLHPEGRIDVFTGRPRGTIIRQRANSPARDTTVIDADRMQIVGEKTFRGWGNVQTRRGTMNSTSQFAEFNEQANRMILKGQAVVQSDTFRLRADSIDAVVVNGDEFRELHAVREVMLESEGVDLTAPLVRLFFNQGEVEKLIAIGGKKIGPNEPQARSVSPDFVLVADSIDALSPQQKLQRVFAVGRARGERFGDTIADRSLPELIRNDWVQGDTVRAFFTDRTPGPRPAGQARPVAAVGADTTRVLERIVAIGAPASSTYRLREQVGDSVAVSVNYLTAKKLDVTFREGAVHKVAAEGAIRGLYLQPPSRAQATTSPVGRP